MGKIIRKAMKKSNPSLAARTDQVQLLDSAIKNRYDKIHQGKTVRTLDYLYRDSASRLILRNYLQSPRSVLDAGAGNGLISKILVEWGCYVVAVDFSPAATKNLKREVPAVDCIIADVRHLPFKEDSFDDEILWGTLEYEGVASEAISEARRLVRDRIILTAWNQHSPLSRASRIIYRDHRPTMLSRRTIDNLTKSNGLNLSSLRGLFLILPAQLAALRIATKSVRIPNAHLAADLAQLNAYLSRSRVTSLLCPVVVVCLSRAVGRDSAPFKPTREASLIDAGDQARPN